MTCNYARAWRLFFAKAAAGPSFVVPPSTRSSPPICPTRDRALLWTLTFPIRAVLRALGPRPREPEGMVRAPALETDRFITRDGVELEFAHWDAASPRAIVVALHGMTERYRNRAIVMPLDEFMARHRLY